MPKKTKLEDVGATQKAACRRAILEMRREGVKLTRDGLRDRAGVDNNAATIVLAAFRQGAFEVVDEEGPGRGASQGRATAVTELPFGAVAFAGPYADRAAAERYAALNPPMGIDDLDGEDLIVAAHVACLLSRRRKLAVRRFAELMVAAEARDLPGLEGEGELEDQLGAEGLDADRRPGRRGPRPLGGARAGSRLLLAVSVDSLGSRAYFLAKDAA